MDTKSSLRIIGNDAMQWIENLSEEKQLDYRQQCIEIYRTIADIQYALEENSSVAAYGESQAGKSYLIDAIFSSPENPFKIQNGSNEYIFNKDINPSNDSGQNEATGLITRFTSRSYDYIAKNGTKYLRLQLLTIADLVIILTEAYRNHVNHDIDQPDDLPNKINDRINVLKENLTKKKNNNLLSAYDICSIKKYIEGSTDLKEKCKEILVYSNLLPFLLLNIEYLQENEAIELISYLWNQNKSFNKLFADLINTLDQLDRDSIVHVELDAIVKAKGSILGVERLDEMYHEIHHEPNYVPTTQIILSRDSSPKSVKKSFLSAVAAEISICVGEFAEKEQYKFLKNIDLLDFPGARHNIDLLESKLEEENNLSLAFRRGKVSYLFNKYSNTRRISGLMFCQNHNDTKANLGASLNNWVLKNVGETPEVRSEYMEQSHIPPLFIISTWFNKNLAWNETRPGEDLSERWSKRFYTVLLNQVVKSDQKDNSQYWFNNWANGVPFQNIFMLRSFKWSLDVFEGYSALTGSIEKCLKPTPAYPNFMEDLKRSFLEFDFVREHFVDPARSWDDAATKNNDGTLPIIDALNKLAPHLDQARTKMFEKLYRDKLTKFIKYLNENHYIGNDPSEKAKRVKREGARVRREMDGLLRKDPKLVAKIFDTLMIPETELYNRVFQILKNAQINPRPESDEYTTYYVAAGLSAKYSREENIKKLCQYLGVDTEEECIEELSQEIENFDIEKLLSKNQMFVGRAEKLVSAIEQVWFTYLSYQFDKLQEWFKRSNELQKNILDIYQHVTPLHSKLTEDIDRYMSILREDVLVGIIADHLAMSFNDFISTCGYYSITDEQRKTISQRNKIIGFGLDEDILNYNQGAYGIVLLEQLDRANKELTRVQGENLEPSRTLLPLPQYNKLWQWEQQLLAMLLLHCDINDEKLMSAEKVVANNQMKAIMDNLKNLLV